MSEKKLKKTGHMQGKQCGYELNDDGSIKVAPMYVSQFEQYMDQRNAVRAVLDSVTQQCAELERNNSKMNRGLWERICDDYGLSMRDAWQYEGEGIIRIKPKDESK